MEKNLPLVVGINPSGLTDCPWQANVSKKVLINKYVKKYQDHKVGHRFFTKISQLLKSDYNHIDLYWGRSKKQRDYLLDNALSSEDAMTFRDKQLQLSLLIIDRLKPRIIVVTNVEAGKILREKWGQEVVGGLKFSFQNKQGLTIDVPLDAKRRGTRVIFLPYIGSGYDNHSLGLWSLFIRGKLKA
jgi:hypothetical protein